MGTCEPLREPDKAESRTPATIMYCLAPDCTMTTWHGLDDWSEDEERWALAMDGRAAHKSGKAHKLTTEERRRYEEEYFQEYGFYPLN